MLKQDQSSFLNAPSRDVDTREGAISCAGDANIATCRIHELLDLDTRKRLYATVKVRPPGLNTVDRIYKAFGLKDRDISVKCLNRYCERVKKGKEIDSQFFSSIQDIVEFLKKNNGRTI